MTAPSAPNDFDLFGQLRLRIEGAGEPHVARLARQLGTAPHPPVGTPHLTIRFDALPAEAADLVLAGPEAGVANGSFVLLRDGGLVGLPLERLGRGAEIRCSPAIQAVPQLVPLVNATFVGLGVLPLHASTAELDGVGVAAAGWSKGGKTEALLALLSAGATAIADEWTYVEPETRTAHGALGPVRLTAAHLAELPELRPLVRAGARSRMRAAGAASGAYARVPDRAWRRLAALRWLHRFAARGETLASAEVSLAQLGGGGEARHTRLERIVLVVSGEGRETTRSTIDAASAVERMVAAHMHHRLGLLELYDTFRFCRPDVRSELIESLEHRERSLLAMLFGDREVTVITHPHPASIVQLRSALLGAIADGP